MAKKKSSEDEEILEEVESKADHFIVEEEDFKMVSSRPNDSRFFDLYFIHTVNKGKEKERKEFKLEGYGFQFNTCIKKIARSRVNSSNQTEFKSLKTLINLYLKEYEEVKKLFRSIDEEL